jgi:uncharacterized membrane protein YczE
VSVQEPGPRLSARRERLVEAVVLALTVLLAGLLGVGSLVTAVREGTVELATVFYPVLLGAIATLAWTRRTRT